MNAAGPFMFGLETERLRVRPLKVDDEAHYRELYTDPETMRYIAPPLSTKSAASSFQKVLVLQSAPTWKSRFLVIEEKETSQRIGICGTSKYEAAALRVEVGIVLKPQASARGLAREALGGLMKKIFAVSPVDEIWVECSTLYPAVERMVSAVGFTPCSDRGQTVGPLASRVWSVRRSCWYVAQPDNSNQQAGK
jgi:ribosomal-protein-alanine N-acetyltransferase